MALTKEKLLTKISNLLFEYEQDLPEKECVKCLIEFASDKLQDSEERLKIYDGNTFVGVKYPERTKQEPEEPLPA